MMLLCVPYHARTGLSDIQIVMLLQPNAAPSKGVTIPHHGAGWMRNSCFVPFPLTANCLVESISKEKNVRISSPGTLSK